MHAGMRLGDIENLLNKFAPPLEAEPWDNVGLLVGDREAAVDVVLFTVDYTDAVAAEARALGAGLVVAYHPPIFSPLKRLDEASPVFRAIRDGVALYSPHTALDVVAGGTNDLLADALQLTDRTPLRPRTSRSGDGTVVGLGRIGRLPEAISRPAALLALKRALGVEHALLAGPHDGDVTRVAVGAGACGELYKEAIAAGAELYVTGEMRHHDALACAAAGLTVVCMLHSNSERAAVRAYAERVLASAAGLRALVSAVDRDPFRFA